MKRRKHKDVAGRGAYNKLNPDGFDFGASLRKPPGESSFARLVRQYKANAKKRGLAFNLTLEQVGVITKTPCAYCGIEPLQKIHNPDANGHYIYNGIDRINPSMGYTLENCVAACKVCNRAKSNMNEQDWREWLNRIVIFHTAAQIGFKKTLEKDEQPKSLSGL